jgi:hypothetical protein
MFASGMTAFRFVTRLRYGRGYCDMPIDARRRWMLKWAEGRVALLRKLFKPVRATALLAYYDHERVKQALFAPDVPAGGLVRAARRRPESLRPIIGASPTEAPIGMPRKENTT